jgi:hypothetical protein
MKRKRTTPRRAWTAELKKQAEYQRGLQWDLPPALIRPSDYPKRDKQAEREAGLRSGNTRRQQKAEDNRQKYLDIAEMLYRRSPRLRRASRHRLADLIRAQLKGPDKVHIRTIERALTPKK